MGLHTLYWRYGERAIRFNGPAFPAAFGNFFTDGAGDEVMVEWAATATCDTRNLYTVEELHNSLSQ